MLMSLKVSVEEMDSLRKRLSFVCFVSRICYLTMCLDAYHGTKGSPECVCREVVSVRGDNAGSNSGPNT